MGSRAWHGLPHKTEEEPEDPEDERPRTRPLLQHQEAPSWKALQLKAALIKAVREQLRNFQKDFGKGWKPFSVPVPYPISAAVMMAELGIIQSLKPSSVPSLKPQVAVVSPHTISPPLKAATLSWFEQFGETFEFGIGEIAAVTVAVGGPLASEFGRSVGSPKGNYQKPPSSTLTGAPWSTGKGGFQTQSIWGGGRKNPLWKMGMDNALLIQTAIKTGNGPLELLEDLQVASQYGVGTAEAFGLFGYI